MQIHDGKNKTLCTITCVQFQVSIVSSEVRARAVALQETKAVQRQVKSKTPELIGQILLYFWIVAVLLLSHLE